MTDLEKNIRALFSFNTKSIEEKEQKLNSNVEEINKRDRTLVEKIGFVGKVDYSNLTPIERSKKENTQTITLNDGSVKTIDEMFNKLLKPSQINYIVDPNERNETKILKIGELNVQFDLAKKGLNTIIDGSTKYIDTINHDRMVNSINHLYKNYIEYNQIVPKSNLLSINKLNNEIGLLEEREKNIIADLNKAYTDYYKKEELVNKSLLKIEDLLVKNIEKTGNKEQDLKLVENLNKIKDLKDAIFNNREELNSPATNLSKEDKKRLNSEITTFRKEVATLMKTMPNDIKKAFDNYDYNVAMLEKSLVNLEKSELNSINHNDIINAKIEKIKRLNNSPDQDDYTKSGIIPPPRDLEQIQKFRDIYDAEYKGEVEQRANQVKVKYNGIPELSDSQYLEYKKALGFFESRHKIDTVNEFGFMGRYQLGVQALEDAGFIKRGSVKTFLESKGDGKVYDGWQKDFLKTQHNSWDLKKCPGGLKGFLKNSDLQDFAMDRYTENNYKALAQKLAEQGKDIKDITPSELPGLLASAHLIGAGGVSSAIREGYFLDTNKKNKDGKEDANGMKYETYLNLVSEKVIANAPDGEKLIKDSEKQVKSKLKENLNLSALDSDNFVAFEQTRNIEDIYRDNSQIKNLENDYTRSI